MYIFVVTPSPVTIKIYICEYIIYLFGYSVYFLQYMTANNVNCLKTWVYLWQFSATWIIINLHDIGCWAIRHHRSRLYIQHLQPSRRHWQDVANRKRRRRLHPSRRLRCDDGRVGDAGEDGGRKKRKASDGVTDQKRGWLIRMIRITRSWIA